MGTFISKHNNKILNQHASQNTTNDHNARLCNCRQPNECPTDGKCLVSNVIYRADVTTTDDGEKKSYIGVTANHFKTRYRNHLKSFNNKRYSANTELSKHVWNLKEANRSHFIKWSIVKKVPAYKGGSKRCNLCLEEKLLIMKDKNLLNKRSELFNKCRHVTRHLVAHCK